MVEIKIGKLSPNVEMVGRKTGQRQQEQHGPELQRHHDADGSRIPVGQLGEDEPVLGGTLHPGAHVGDERAACPNPVVEAAQRAEGAFHRTILAAGLNLWNRGAGLVPGM
jgi:hypothetical protein